MGLGFLLHPGLEFIGTCKRLKRQSPANFAAKPFVGRFYHTLDRVTHAKVFLCVHMPLQLGQLFLCGLPAIIDPLKLPDGRVLCSRDA
jgi:hypothetical protein